MASIYIVNVSVGGYYTEQHSYYHRSEGEAVDSFEECKASVGEDPTLIELVRLDTETLEAVTITGWEGAFGLLDEEDAESGEEGFGDERAGDEGWRPF
jgi:hypothetical protein